MLCVTLGGLVPTMCMIIFACVFEYVWTQMAENEQIKVKNQVRITGQVVPHYSTVMLKMVMHDGADCTFLHSTLIRSPTVLAGMQPKTMTGAAVRGWSCPLSCSSSLSAVSCMRHSWRKSSRRSSSWYISGISALDPKLWLPSSPYVFLLHVKQGWWSLGGGLCALYGVLGCFSSWYQWHLCCSLLFHLPI